MSHSTSEYLQQLQTDKQNLVNNLVTKGVNATNDETFTSLVPKILDISSGDEKYFDFELVKNNNSSDRTVKAILKIPNFETSDWTNFDYLFDGCNNLESIPQINTSNGTSFRYTFRDCYALTSIPEINTSKGKDFSYFLSGCRELISITKLDLSNGTNFNSIFSDCRALTNLPELNTSNATAFNNMFSNCSSLTNISKIDASNCINFANVILGCSGLKNLGGFLNAGKAYTQKSSNYINYRINLSHGANLTHDSIMNVINNLYDLNLTYNVAGGGTLYSQQLVLGSNHLPKLTDEEILIATNKGWTVS